MIKNKILDKYLGKTLVGIDILIRKTGVLNSALQKEFIEHNNFKIFYGKEDNSLISFILTNNDYERETREVIENIISQGDTFFDLGANIGFFSLLTARIVGDEGKIYAFEPTPSTLKFLTKNISENNFNNRVIVEKYAVSNKIGKVNFRLNKGSECNSITENSGQGTISVNTITLDKYVKDRKIKKVDLIKMDIEGQEFSALQGMKDVNKTNKDLKIIFEFHKENLNENGMTGLEIFLLLKDYGFNRFTVLFRKPYEILIPDDFHIIQAQATRENLNILAEKIII